MKAVAVQNTKGFIWISQKKELWSAVFQIEEDMGMEHPELFSTFSHPRKWGQIVWICVACPFISSSEILSQYISCAYGDKLCSPTALVNPFCSPRKCVPRISWIGSKSGSYFIVMCFFPPLNQPFWSGVFHHIFGCLLQFYCVLPLD